MRAARDEGCISGRRAGARFAGAARTRQDIHFDYFKVRNIPTHLGHTRKDPWTSFDKTSQMVSKTMFKRVGSQASRA